MSGAKAFTTRTLLVCVVLGAFSGVLAIASRVLGLALQTALPWLSFPAPLPWFLGVLVAGLLVRRPGAALLASVVGAIVAFGALVVCGGIVVELVLLALRRLPRLAAALAVGAGVGLMSFGFMYLYPEFRLLPAELHLLGLAVRIVLCVGYGWFAWWLAVRLARAGFGPDPDTAPKAPTRSEVVAE